MQQENGAANVVCLQLRPDGKFRKTEAKGEQVGFRVSFGQRPARGDFGKYFRPVISWLDHHQFQRGLRRPDRYPLSRKIGRRKRKRLEILIHVILPVGRLQRATGDAARRHAAVAHQATGRRKQQTGHPSPPVGFNSSHGSILEYAGRFPT